MAGSFLPINLTSDKVMNATSTSNGVNPIISQFVGQQKTAQHGNSPTVSAIQNIAQSLGASKGLSNFLFPQQSAIPQRKYVSFRLRDSKGDLAQPSAPNAEDFRPGYEFTMFVNPSNLNIAYGNKTVNATRTLGGWKLQHWYPDLGSITGDGLIGNMLERFNSDLKDSAAWKNFNKLLQTYHLNGLKYVVPQAGQNRFELHKQFLPIAELTFDKVNYVGYFESFNYVESEETPHTIKYNFAFKFHQFVDTRDIAGMTRAQGSTLPITFRALTGA
jgi:hypothetical protein